MKFGDSSRSHRKTWFIGERQFIGIYTFNCRDLHQPRLISHAAPATPQKYRVSGETRTVKTPSACEPLFRLFSCNGQPVIVLVSAKTARRLIVRKSSDWPNSRPTCGFFADLPETTRPAAASSRRQNLSGWRRVRLWDSTATTITSIIPIQREEKKKDKECRKRIRNSGRKCIGWRKWVRSLHPAYCSLVAGKMLSFVGSYCVAFLCLADNRRSLSARINHIDLRMSVCAFARSHSRFLLGDNSSRVCRWSSVN